MYSRNLFPGRDPGGNRCVSIKDLVPQGAKSVQRGAGVPPPPNSIENSGNEGTQSLTGAPILSIIKGIHCAGKYSLVL